MELYLIQHGEAVSEEINPERPLSEKGISDVKKVAAFLKQAGININTIFHSSKRRAHQTAQLLADTLNPKSNVLQKEGLTPNDPIDNIYREILKRDEDLMIVGHLPFLAKLAGRLLLDSEDKNIIEFKQGSALLLSGRENSWKVKWFITPDLV
jgi:phosphohistidine phosphatase